MSGLLNTEQVVEACQHLPMLSEPTLTLYCAKCGAWLKDQNGTLEVVQRKDATRGVHRCQSCGVEWIGDEDWCEECQCPTWGAP